MPHFSAHDLEADVLVVGAGITGALAANALWEAGQRVIIADRRDPLTGSTPATTALVQYEIDTPLVELQRRLGATRANAAYLASRRALDELLALARTLPEDCEIRHRRSLQIARRTADIRRLRAESDARSVIGLGTGVLSRRELRREFGILRPGALQTETAMELNPLKLAQSLFHRMTSSTHPSSARSPVVVLPGANIDWSPISRQCALGKGFEFVSNTDTRLRVRHVVVATGYETPEQFNEVCRLTKLRSTYAAVVEPNATHHGPQGSKTTTEPWPEGHLLWETGRAYFYARTLPNGRIMLGGEDNRHVEAHRRDRLITRNAGRLARKLARLFPNNTRFANLHPAFAWAGTFAETKDGLPYIGELPQWPRVHFALGYGGNGITFSVIAAQIIREAILGREHPDAHLFAFDRA